MTETRTFSIDLYCLNCGAKWSEEVPRGTEIKRGLGVWLHPYYCTKINGVCGRTVECPTCGLTSQVKHKLQ